MVPERGRKKKPPEIIGVIDIKDDKRRIRLSQDRTKKGNWYLEFGLRDSETNSGFKALHRQLTIYEDEVEAVTKLSLAAFIYRDLSRKERRRDEDPADKRQNNGS